MIPQHRSLSPARARRSVLTLAAGAAAIGVLAAFHRAADAQPAAVDTAAAPSRVQIVQTAEGYQLLRNGEPYFIRGGGGQRHMDKLRAAGGNSIRTWNVRNLDNILDAAQAEGLTVTVGLPMGHQRHGFDYNDPAAVSQQLENARAAVRQYRHHPALLMWGVGNEVEGRGDNPAVWRAINDIALMVKEEDPNHPTAVVLAEATQIKIDHIKQYVPAIDVLGVNGYRSLHSLPVRLRNFGWTKPYAVLEFGPPGPWQTAKTEWNAPLEMNSAEKAEFYLKSYESAIASEPHWCFGSYAFQWGNKQEATATWFGMLLPDGTLLPTVDAMTYAWTGEWPAHRAPDVTGMEMATATGAALSVEKVGPGVPLAATVQATSPNGYPLTVRWDLRDENVNRRQGGDFEEDPDAHPVPETTAETLSFPAPQTPGPYRLFAYVYDGKGKAGTVNLPFLVIDPGAAASSPEPAQGAEQPN